MNESEYQQLNNCVVTLSRAISNFERTNDPSDIYDTSAQIDALYGEEISGISDAFETMGQQSGLAKRNANIILAFLKRYMVSENGSDRFSNKMDNTFLTHASEVLGDTNTGLSGAQIVKYCNSYAIDFDVIIPVDNANSGKFGSSVPNKRTALLRNLQAFNAKQQFQIIKELSELDFFRNNKEASKLKDQLYTKYGFLAEERLSNTELVVKTKHWLEKYPESLKQYTSALTKYEGGIFERNTLDDMRLSFELLIKEILGNKRSLENQITELGGMLKNTDTSIELRNMVMQVIKYYTDFQNNHVKHNDKVNSNEIEYVIELTSVVMKFLIKISGGTN